MDYPALFSAISFFVGAIGTAIAVSRGIDKRFSELRHDAYRMEQKLTLEMTRLQGQIETLSQREASHHDHLLYLINSNTQLIDHRTKRYKENLGQVTTRLEADIGEIKQFLDKTTEFTIRTHPREEA